MQNYSLNECLYICMRNGDWWTYWDLQSVIKDNTGKLYGEPTISAGIRNFRKTEYRKKFGLPMIGEVVYMKSRKPNKGYKFKLITEKTND